MNRTKLAYPVAVLAVAAVLACGWLRSAAAEDERPSLAPASAATTPQPLPLGDDKPKMKPIADVRTPQPRSGGDETPRLKPIPDEVMTPRAKTPRPVWTPPERIIEVYRLRYISAQTAMSVLQSLWMDDAVRITSDRRDGLIVFAPREAHEKVKDLLKKLDVRPPEEPEKQTKMFTLVYAEPASAAKSLLSILPKGTQIAVDERTGCIIVSGPERAVAEATAVLKKLDEQRRHERMKPPASYEVRVLWLANDSRGEPPADDLKDVVAELARLGIKDVRQIGQMVVQTSTGTSFNLSSLPNFAGEPAGLTASGTLLEENDGAVMMNVSIRAMREGKQRQMLSNIDTRIVLPQKQYVVLATAPVGNITSTFVVQVTSRAKVAGGK